MIDLTEDIRIRARDCVKCGACLSVCPTYKELCEESASPRGRTALADEVGSENIELTKNMVEIFTKCLACASCEEICPKGIPVTKIIYEMREMLYNERHYDKVFHAIIKLIYNSPYAFSLLMKNAALLKPVLFEDIKSLDLIKPRIPLPFLKRSRLLPKMGQKFFLDNDFPDESKEAGHISLYTGCIFNYIYPDIAAGSLKILRSLGKNVHVTNEQMCCGFPALSVGDFHSLKENVLKNIDILSESHAEKIVVLCSSCSLMFKKYYPMVFDGDSEHVRDKIRKFADKVVDFSIYLNEHIDQLEKSPKPQEKIKATYHLPCHLIKGLTKDNVIKKILSRFENVEIIDPENPESCCGFGGVFNYKYSDLSQKISDRKANDLIETKAEIVVTSCSGCIMQIKEGLCRHGSDMKVKHISELIT